MLNKASATQRIKKIYHKIFNITTTRQLYTKVLRKPTPLPSEPTRCWETKVENKTKNISHYNGANKHACPTLNIVFRFICITNKILSLYG